MYLNPFMLSNLMEHSQILANLFSVDKTDSYNTQEYYHSMHRL